MWLLSLLRLTPWRPMPRSLRALLLQLTRRALLALR
jgi:hypothetical protein